MGQLLIRNLDEAIKQRLRERAAEHGRSMEAEVRDIIERAIVGEPASASKPRKSVGELTREIFEPLGGVDLPDVRDRTPHKPIVSFD